mgnify:CR=1 FL=1
MPTKTPNTVDFTNFSHRFNMELPTNPNQLSDCINPALERAAAIADLMEMAFVLNTANELSNLWRAAQAIRLEIMDASVILDAYVDGAGVAPEQADIAGGE